MTPDQSPDFSPAMSKWAKDLYRSLFLGTKGPFLAALLAFLAALGGAMIVPVIDRDEARFAQATTQMIETGDYININYQEEPRHKKPIGIHWAQAASVKLTSKVEDRSILAYRWPSIIGAALAAFACAYGAGRIFGANTALKAGLLFGVGFMLSTEGLIAKTDALLCGLITLLMAALAQIYLATRNSHDPTADEAKKLNKSLMAQKLIFWFAMAFAILVKGPMAVMVCGLTVMALFGLDRKLPMWRFMGLGWGLLIVLAICGPWAIMITIATDGAFWTGAVGQDLARKLNSGDEGHSGPIGYHLALLPVMLFPASFLLGTALQTALTRFREAGVRFALCWLVPSFVVFELMPTKLPHYVLPTYCALIWLCAAGLETPEKLWARVVNWAGGLIGGAVIVALSYLGYSQYGTPALWPMVIVIGVAALVLSGVGRALLDFKRASYGLGALIAAGFIAHLGFVTLAANLEPLWLSRKMETTMRALSLDPRQGVVSGPVAIIGYAEPSFVFRMGTKTMLLNEDVAAAAVALGEKRPLWVDDRFLDRVLKEARAQGVSLEKKAEISGTNYNGGRDVTLSLYLARAEGEGEGR